MCERDRCKAWGYYASTYLGILLQGATMPSLHPKNFWICLEGVKASGHYASTCLGYSFSVAPCPP